MEIRNVHTFIKITEFNSFTKAADALGYSQAAVTAHIKAMEKELGMPLFDRIGKSIALTQAGETFLPYARRLIKAEEEAVQSVKPADHLSGDLMICSASSYAMSVLPGILMGFMDKHSGVSVTVKVSDYFDDTLPRVARGEIDFLACLDEGSVPEGFSAFAKKRELLAFVTYPDNPLAKNKKLRIEDIVQSNFIVSDLDIGYCASLAGELNQRGIEFKPAMDMSSVGAIINMLLGGYGVSLLPEFTVSDYIQSGKLATLNVPDVNIELYSYFICSRDRWINPIMQEFIRFAEQNFEDVNL